jgi:hypothetical protein
MTALACQFIDKETQWCYLLGRHEPDAMLKAFLDIYNEADMVTGHYIRGYDLPLINATLLEYGYPPLEEKLTQDTKIDLIDFSGLSKSQENLAAMLLAYEKTQMDQSMWREANRLTKKGIKLTEKRVRSDVKQHIELRAKLLELEMLKPPKLWTGSGARSKYHP